jgi:hypothetical protein
MGSYTEISVAGYPLIDSKSFVIPELMTVFRETDKRVFERKVFERNPLVWGTLDNAEEANHETERAVEYSTEAKKIIDRLNVMGFTLARARSEFEAGRLSEIAKFESWAEDRQETSWFADEWDVVREFTFDLYADGLKQIIEQSLRPRPFDDNEKQELSRFVKYMLSQEDYFLGFLGGEPRLLLRVACELVPPDSRVIQDITEVTHAGYYEENESVCENAIQELVESYPENSPIIILAEGSSDITILKESLAVLFPHLEGYYSFLEFDSARVPGGAGYLVSMVKAFAGAGIANRIIAIFDNDTAAHDATRSLKQIRIPPNIAILHYPSLELLRAYPTLVAWGVGFFRRKRIGG